ncbi:MAG TPA: hypothetical protein VHD36_15590 [Pirellulales bacterium]|nr:hypothetical protein [Pirellulales bacterium]
MAANSLQRARAAKAKAAETFGKLASVVGIGITKVDDDYALKVNLDSEPPADVTLPTEVSGVPVKVEIVGQIKKR